MAPWCSFWYHFLLVHVEVICLIKKKKLVRCRIRNGLYPKVHDFLRYFKKKIFLLHMFKTSSISRIVWHRFVISLFLFVPVFLFVCLSVSCSLSVTKTTGYSQGARRNIPQLVHRRCSWKLLQSCLVFNLLDHRFDIFLEINREA